MGNVFYILYISNQFLLFLFYFYTYILYSILTYFVKYKKMIPFFNKIYILWDKIYYFGGVKKLIYGGSKIKKIKFYIIYIRGYLRDEWVQVPHTLYVVMSFVSCRVIECVGDL